MKRIYFLVPNLKLTRVIVDALLLARVEERRIHVVAKVGTPMGDLPEATLLQKSDLIPAMERGLAIGGAVGALSGLVAMMWPTGPGVEGGALILGGALAGAGFGTWVAGMVGLTMENSRLHAYEAAIEHGHLLLMVDVEKVRLDRIYQLIQYHYPGVVFEDTEMTAPAFP